LNDTGFNIEQGTLTFSGLQLTSAAPAFLVTQSGQATVSLINVINSLDPVFSLTVTGVAASSSLSIQKVQTTSGVVDWQSGSATISINEIIGSSLQALISGPGTSAGNLFLTGINWTNDSGAVLNLPGDPNGNTGILYLNILGQALSTASDTIILSGSWGRSQFSGRYQATNGGSSAFNLSILPAPPIIFQSVVAVASGPSILASVTNGKVYGYLLVNTAPVGITFTTGAPTVDPSVV
jgi:hypothetical protein